MGQWTTQAVTKRPENAYVNITGADTIVNYQVSKLTLIEIIQSYNNKELLLAS